jgi:hypothetical protein
MIGSLRPTQPPLMVALFVSLSRSPAPGSTLNTAARPRQIPIRSSTGPLRGPPDRIQDGPDVEHPFRRFEVGVQHRMVDPRLDAAFQQSQ